MTAPLSFTETHREEGGFFVWDFAVGLVHGDSAFARLYGFTHAEAEAGLSIADITQRIHKNDRKLIAERMKSTILASGSYHEDYRIVRPDGTTLHVHSTGRCFANSYGPAYCSGIVYPMMKAEPLSAKAAILDLCLSAHAIAKSNNETAIVKQIEHVFKLLAGILHVGVTTAILANLSLHGLSTPGL